MNRTRLYRTFRPLQAAALTAAMCACGGTQTPEPSPTMTDDAPTAASAFVATARWQARAAIWPDDDTVALREALAAELVAAAELVSALHHLEWLALAHADDYRVFAVLGDVRLRGTGDAQGALEAAHRCLLLAPGVAECLLLQGRAQYDLGLVDEAALSIAEGLVAQPDDDEARVLLARIQISHGRYDEAREVLAPLVQAAVPSLATLLLAANLEERAGDLVAARAAFERVALLHPDPTQGLGHLRAFLERIGDTDGTRDVDRRLRSRH